MPSDTANPRPFVDTAIARHIISRLLLTHHERGIVVISGPWGIGKTTAIEAFASTVGDVVIIKVEPGGAKTGASTISVLQQIAKAFSALFDDVERLANQKSVYALRDTINRQLSRWWPYQDVLNGWEGPLAPFTIIFDEAQYLSREAIDYLRYWNDSDRTTTPFPIGLAFIGNPEFSLDRKRGADSVISGAVRSRALFVESLDYLHVTETDLTLFVQSRGITDAKAIARIVKHYTTESNVADLRNADRLIPIMLHRADGAPVTAEIVESVLG